MSDTKGRDRPVAVEITREMLIAGEGELCGFSPEVDSYADTVKAIYSAMAILDPKYQKKGAL